MSRCNDQCSRCHGKENQDLCQIEEVVERRHQGKKKDGWEREEEITELGGGCLRIGRAPEVDLAVPEMNVE